MDTIERYYLARTDDETPEDDVYHQEETDEADKA